METARLLVSIGLMTLLGWSALFLITRGRGLRVAEVFALSYILGVGLVTLEMLGFYLVGVPLTPKKLLILWPALIVPAALAYRRARFDGTVSEAFGARPSVPFRPVDIMLSCGIAFEVCYAFFRAFIKPIESYDAIAIYAVKSKMLFFTRVLNADFFLSLKALFPHPDYPLNIPFAETFLYLMMGSFNDQLVKIIFPLYFVALLALLYNAVRRFAGMTYALFFCFILATIPMVGAYAANAYHELPLSCYYFASALLLFRWFDRPDRPYLLALSAVLVGLAAWTKNEGLLYCVVNTAVLGVFVVFNARKMRLPDALGVAAYPVIVLALTLPWALVKRSFGIVNSEIDLANINPVYLAAQLHKFLPILDEFQKQVFGPKKWNLIWIAAIAILVMYRHKVLGGVQRRYIALSLCLTVAGYVLFYLISYVDVGYFVSKTWARFLLHFLPVVVYWLALLLKDDIRL